MDKYLIKGGTRLEGKVRVSGAKNAALPILAATLMTGDECVVEGVPDLKDIHTMVQLLRNLGVEVTCEGTSVRTRVVNEDLCEAPYKLMKTMRAGFCVLGPLLGKRKRARVSLPGGCSIGPRPVELHLKGLQALGADIPVCEGGYVESEVERLRGTEMYLGGPYGSTVLGTANVLMAAVLAEGGTVIEGAAIEPEIQDLCRFLVCMGARIHGIGTHRLEVDGVGSLHGTRYRIIPDRIEAGTFMVAGAITRGEVEVDNVYTDHLLSVMDTLRNLGVTVEKTQSGMGCKISVDQELRPQDIYTLPYPGVPTDMQAQIMAFLCTVPGASVVHEKVFPDRFIHVAELNRMGARISQEGAGALIHGGRPLSAAPVQASDLRAGAALVLAGMAASGTTELDRIYHLDRGYSRFEEKLNSLGAGIERVKA